MPLGVTPMPEGQAEETPEGLLSFLQWQQDGTNLGTATVDTVNLGSGITGTRGTGENANVLTLTAEGGEGGAEAPTLVLNLEQGGTAPTFEGNDYTGWVVTERVASADASWDTNAVAFTRTGLYEVYVHATIESDSGNWRAGYETVYGSAASGAELPDRSVHARNADLPGLANSPANVRFMDRYLFNVADIETDTLTPAVYARGYSAISSDTATMSATVTVKRVAAAIVGA